MSQQIDTSSKQVEDGEDLNIIEKLNRIDEDPDLEELDTIAPGELRSINKTIITKYKLLIEESQKPSELIEYSHQAFQTISSIANTIVNRNQQILLKNLAQKILDRIDIFTQAQNIESQDNSSSDFEIFDQVIVHLATCLSSLETLSNSEEARLTLTAANGLIGLVQAFQTKRFKPKFNERLVKVLIDIAHNLAQSEQLFNRKAEKVYKFIKGLRDYDNQKFLEVIQSSNKLTKFTYLAHYLKDNGNDAKILSQISDKLNSVVLNDKDRSNHYNVRFFVTYLRNLDNQTFLKDVYSQIEFMMKRNGNLLGVVALVVSHLNSLQFNQEILTSLTDNVITNDFLVSADYQIDCSLYLKNLASKVTDLALLKQLLIDYLLKRFTTTKAQFNVNQRQNVIKHIQSALEGTSQDKLDQDSYEQICIAFVEHIFSVKEEQILRDCYDSVVKVLLKSNSNVYLAAQVKKYTQKASNQWQVTVFTELISHNKADLNEVILALVPQFKQQLSAENFKTVANFSSILALTGFFAYASEYLKDTSLVQVLASNPNVLGYLATDQGYINTQGYFQKGPSALDVKYHLKTIEVLLQQHYFDTQLSTGDVQLRDTLFELLLNQSFKFREHYFIDVIEKLCSTPEKVEIILPSLLKSLYLKVKQVSLRPIQLTREESPHQEPLSIRDQIRLTLKFLLRYKNKELSHDEFFNTLKIVCHPYVSDSNKALVSQIKSLQKVFQDKEVSLESYIQKYGKEIAEQSVQQRTGILANDKTLRAQAVNLATFLAYQGGLELFLGDLVQILDYKPFELLQKLENLFIQEFDRISHYDLMFYSEICKDLQTVFNTVDSKLYQLELGVEQDQVSSQNNQGGQQEEEKKQEAAPEVIDPAKLAAQMLKAQAAQKKAAAAKKGAPAKGAPAKVAPKKEAPKPAAQQQKKEDPKAQLPAMDKEARNKFDRQQLLNYFNHIQTIKQTQIETAYEILKRVNLNGFNLDTTFAHLLSSMIKLLNYSYSKFSTLICFQTILSYHKRDPLFLVKNELVSCMQAISQGRIFLKHQREFQQIFQHIEANANLDTFDKGYTQLVMSMGNYVLKDLSVNLSVKEQALSVIQSFLSTDKVLDIELVRVTINMMKSSYNSPNLQPYLNELLKRLRPEYIALILQRLFEYEPVPRMAILKELVEYDQPLFCPVWMATHFWILQFDEESSKLARRIWNRYGMSLRTAVIDLAQEERERNVFFYLRSKNTNIYDASLKATVAAIEIFQNRYDLIIDDLIEFYNQELQIIEQETLTTEIQSNLQGYQASVGRHHSHQMGSDHQTNAKILGDDRLNRKAVADILLRTAHLVQANSFKKIYEFFVTKGCLDQNETVAKASMAAALQIIKTKGSDYSEEILKILEKFINEKQKYSEQSKNQAIIMIGNLAQYLDNTSQKKLVGTFEKMLELLNTPSELIRQSICKVIPQLARYFDDKSRRFLEDNFQILRTSMDEKLLRGSAYAVAGIVKGLGMQTLTQLDIIPIIQKECFFKNADPMRKIAGLYLFECMSISMGKVFEMNIEKVLPSIMSCISDHKDNVRRAAIQSNKTIMGNLSNYAIKQVLPIFLKGLEVENWRSKLASVEALGNMAFCAPRQISGFLPRIVKGIREVLNDTHEKVHEASLQAIQNIGSVIKCPEIAEILEFLVQALSNPSQHLKQALKMLLETSFVHAIDAPSLSLLIPILDSGLMMHDNESKTLASRLMGNICNLTQDPEDLLPYITILKPAIQNSLFDSIPEIRASAGKALGSLSRGLGLSNSNDIIEWLIKVLNERNLQSSERQGAAQGLAEIVSVHGQKFFEETVEKIIVQSSNPDPQIRESFRAVMVFLATCYDQFVKYLPKLLPIMIQGLSDDTEDVRKISMRNVKICIRQFARQAPNQLVLPIMEMMFHEDFKVRQSSSVLMYQLVKELENDVIKSQPKYITNETKEEILGAMFILRYDIIERVALQAAQIWKNLIDNQLKIVKQILPTLISQVFKIIQSDWLELQEMGLNCMRGIVEKFGEKVVNDTLDILEGYFERAKTLAQTLGISKALYNMTNAAPTKLLSDLRNRFLGIMDPYLSHDNEEIRNLAGLVFNTTFQKTYEPVFVTQALDRSFLKKLHSFILQKNDTEARLLVESLVKMIKDAPDLKIEDKLIRLCQLDVHENPITIAQARILAAVSPKIAQHMFKKKFYGNVLNALIQELTIDEIEDEVRIQEVLKTFSELLSKVPENEIVTINESIIADFYLKCRDRGRLSFYVDFIAYYCTKATVNYEKFAGMYLRNILVLMNDKDEKLVEKVVKAFNSIIGGLQKENQFAHIYLIKEVIEEIAVDQQTINYGGDGTRDRTLYRKKVPTIKMLEKAEGVKTLSGVIQNSITHGSIEVRIDSAILFQYLIDFSKIEAIKMELIKICGALIRVVNDKFPSQLKIQIFLALKLILVKANLFVKAMAPQLQTTFLKAFNDSLATPVLRKIVVECLVQFLKIAPKIDPIVKELSTMLDGDKIDNNSKVEVAESLAVIIKLSGKTIQQAMSQSIFQTLQTIIQQKKHQFNEKTIVNCAVALAFLSLYTQDAKQQLDLFEQYDNIMDVNVSLGVKFGILMGGAPLPDRAAFLKKLQSYTLEVMKDMSGIAEIDSKPYDDDIKEEEEQSKLYGAFMVLGHIGDSFLRRFANPVSGLPEQIDLFTLYYQTINQSEIFKNLNDDQPFEQTQKQVLYFLSTIPVKQTKNGDFIPELKQVISEGMEFINNFYLEFSSKKDVFPAVINLSSLNYDNFLEQNDDKTKLLTKKNAREKIFSPLYQDVLNEDLKWLAVELLFIQ